MHLTHHAPYACACPRPIVRDSRLVGHGLLDINLDLDLDLDFDLDPSLTSTSTGAYPLASVSTLAYTLTFAFTLKVIDASLALVALRLGGGPADNSLLISLVDCPKVRVEVKVEVFEVKT